MKIVVEEADVASRGRRRARIALTGGRTRMRMPVRKALGAVALVVMGAGGLAAPAGAASPPVRPLLVTAAELHASFPSFANETGLLAYKVPGYHIGCNNTVVFWPNLGAVAATSMCEGGIEEDLGVWPSSGGALQAWMMFRMTDLSSSPSVRLRSAFGGAVHVFAFGQPIAACLDCVIPVPASASVQCDFAKGAVAGDIALEAPGTLASVAVPLTKLCAMALSRIR